MSFIALAMLFAVTASPLPPEPEPPITVWLGVDCGAGAEPFTVSLPDDVVIAECEGERSGAPTLD